MPITKNRLPIHKAKTSIRKNQMTSHQKTLNDIASMDIRKLSEKEILPVDRSGNIDISSSHPNYKFWVEDDDK